MALRVSRLGHCSRQLADELEGRVSWAEARVNSDVCKILGDHCGAMVPRKVKEQQKLFSQFPF